MSSGDFDNCGSRNAVQAGCSFKSPKRRKQPKMPPRKTGWTTRQREQIRKRLVPDAQALGIERRIERRLVRAQSFSNPWEGEAAIEALLNAVKRKRPSLDFTLADLHHILKGRA
jgi:hypothetical protein